MLSDILIFVEPYVQNLPFANADAGVAALMCLVAIVSAKVVQLALGVDAPLVDGKET